MKRRGEAMMLAAGGSLPARSEARVDQVFPALPVTKRQKGASPDKPPLPPSRTASDAATHSVQLPEHLQLLQTMFGRCCNRSFQISWLRQMQLQLGDGGVHLNVRKP